MTSTPKAITDTILALRSERIPLAARLDAIDLAIDNLSRVYGLHGSPQPLPLDGPRRVQRKAVAREGRTQATAADLAQRDTLLALIGKVDSGMTISELRKQTPKMDGADRSKALQALKDAKQIRRAGNAWVKAA